MEKKKEVQKNQKLKERGITLIALVITIIVLLILAGVALATLTGDSGILSNSEKAKENTEKANLKEEVSIKVMEHKIEPNEDLKKYLEDVPNVKIEDARTDTFYVTRGNTTLTVYKDGEVIEGKALWDGKSSESPEIKKVSGVFNWYIYTPAQLKFLAEYVNSGKDLTGTLGEQLRKSGYDPNEINITEESTVYLMNDLDLGAREVNGKWEGETVYEDKTDVSRNKTNEDFEWTPIGNIKDKKLVATFEGNGYTIRGVYINEDTTFNGIFGNSNSIKNLTIENSYIKGAAASGGVVGALRSGVIENCHNVNTTVISENNASFTCVGGVAGQIEGDMLSCSNTGKIFSTGMEETVMSQVGGVLGLANTNCLLVSNCYNAGTVEADGMFCGGVVGNTTSSNNTRINNCYNTGIITGKSTYVGGVTGSLKTSVTVSNCYNTGVVTGGMSTGGIAGNLEKTIDGDNTKIENCYNSGIVSGKNKTGGIVGDVQATSGQGIVTKCYNKGKVEGTTNVGAVIGKQENTTGTNTLNNLYYLNTVGMAAIGDEQDNDSNKIMSTTENITSYKKFIKWIQNK